MALSGEAIRARLTAFAARWSVYEGSERGEAQTFLNALFACYGTARSEVAHFEHAQAGRFLDLIWPRVCLIEMKSPTEAGKLAKHREQALAYWRDAADRAKGVPAPRFVVICAFRRLEIWEPGLFPKEPRVVLDLVDLPDQYDVLLFLAGREPMFAGGQAALTREAVVHVIDLYEQLKERRAAGPDELRDLVLQSVWCLFAEDLGQLPEHAFTRVLDDLIANPHRSSADDLGGLFAWLDDPSPERPRRGVYAGVRYANGTLFAAPARVDLTVPELEQLRAAAGFNWRLVEPSIFGSLLEGGLGHDKQWALGAHYTHEADIQKVIQPTIVEPWRERIENLSTHAQAVEAQNDLLDYVVLDPACGSGNFLYVAYRELRRLERRLAERELDLRRKAGMKEQGSLSVHFPLGNIRGIEIDSFAVSLARVTLWMGHKLAVDELDLSEATLPLADLSGIQVADALRIEWPRADAIIGNPPFHGDRHLRRILGDDYVEWLKREFGVGVKDYCVYWFRKAHDRLADGARAGLVGTNSISQNRARGASLEYIVESGGVITDAVSSQDWPGEAAVDVSIVNWVKNPPNPDATARLDARDVAIISPALVPAASDITSASRLPQNAGRCFYGPIPAGGGFVLSREQAESYLADANSRYRDVVRPYLTGHDIASDPRQEPSRYIIDFGLRTLEQAIEYPEALDAVRLLVKPEREKTRRKAYRERWWRFAEPLVAMRDALEPLSRYVAGMAQGKRVLFCWAEPWTCPSNLTTVFAFEDDAAMGVLASSVHARWARAQGSTLEDRMRYTPNTSFGTFPWPLGPLDTVADVAKRLYVRRSEICLERDIGLTKLYNQLDEGAWTDLRDLHRELDEAVAAAYGWPHRVAHDPDETNRRLLELNRAIAAGEIDYRPFG
ncbi:MAG: class I SAM-dependent DNA methyltransferase [Gaiellaceae bacterium]